jgi:hypothetical protein
MCLNETYSKVHIGKHFSGSVVVHATGSKQPTLRLGKHLSDSFPIQNDLQQGNSLPPLL